MTQIKLWQIVSKSPNTLIVSDNDGNLVHLVAGSANQVLLLGADGKPAWVDNEALAVALAAKNQSESLLADAKAYTLDQIAKLVDDAPVALDTLRELADKLGGQDNALGALLLQLEQKANTADVYSKTEADGLLAASLAAGNASVDQKIADAAVQTNEEIQTAKSEAIAIAADDAQQKSDTAQANAIHIIGQQLLGTYGVESAVTACLYGSSKDFTQSDVMAHGMGLSGLYEITGVTIDPKGQLISKVVFINGLAVNGNWQQTEKDAAVNISNAVIRFDPDLAKRIFDGDDNSILVLVTVNSVANIIVKPVLA